MDDLLLRGALISFITFIIQQIFKTVLDYKKYKVEVVFNKLHQERAEVIKELFQRLTILYQEVFDFTRFIKPAFENETSESIELVRKSAVENAYVNAKNYFYLNKLYLPNSICKDIEILLSKMDSNVMDYDLFNRQIQESLKVKDRINVKEGMSQCKEIRHRVEDELLKLLSRLEEDFKLLLGNK